MDRNIYHEGEPDLNEEKENWLSLPEETRDLILAYVQGAEIDFNDLDRAELQRNLRWNIINLRKLLLQEEGAVVPDSDSVQVIKNSLEMYENAQRRLELKVLGDGLHQEQDN